MNLDTSSDSRSGRRRPRAIGPFGTVARIVIGGALLADVVVGHATGGWRPLSWLLALVVFPAVVLAGQALWVRMVGQPLHATGPLGHAVNAAVFLALYLSPAYAPGLEATSDAALIFYGGSMLVAAVRGYAGCEVLAVSNWLLGRQDEVGCAVFGPVDLVERTRQGRQDAPGLTTEPDDAQRGTAPEVVDVR